MILNEAHGTTFVVGMFLEVVLEDGVSLLCGVVLPRILYKVISVRPVLVELGAIQVEATIHHFHIHMFAWHKWETHAMGADRAVREGGEEVCQIGLVNIGGEGTRPVFYRNVVNLTSGMPIVSVVQANQIARVANALRDIDVHVEIRFLLLHLRCLMNVPHYFKIEEFFTFPIILSRIMERERLGSLGHRLKGIIATKDVDVWTVVLIYLSHQGTLQLVGVAILVLKV